MNRPQSIYNDLPVSERIQLVEDIWDSIADEGALALRLDRADAAEMQRRLDAHHAAPGNALAWSHVRDELFGTD